MIRKNQRLTKKEFDTCFKNGRRKHSPLFQLIYTTSDVFHGASVVGKKVSKKAVNRNKIRRRMYAALYAIHTQQHLSGTYIVIAKPPVLKASYCELKDELSKLIKSR